MEPGGGVDEVARHHALVRGTDGDGRLAGQDAGSGLDRRSERAYRLDELEGCPDSPFGVVLLCRRSAPDCHNRIADELLDRPAIAADDVRGQLEVARQGLTNLLGVAFLGERGEPDEVGEEDGHEAALGGWTLAGGTARGGRGRRQCGRFALSGAAGGRRMLACLEATTAFAAEPGIGVVGGPAGRARDRQGRSAGLAELPTSAVLRRAVRADHRVTVSPVDRRRRA